jgi:hypothetical protein
MLARLLRLVVVLAIIAVVLVLFFYAFLAALIVAPVLLLLFFLFGRRIKTIWVVGQPLRTDDAPAHRPAPPMIDHDPNDLPENKQ